MRYLTLVEVVDLHTLIIGATGGAGGIRDLGALESAIAQPKATFDMNDLYPTLVDKAAALCFSIVQGNPFVDGNKRTGHAAMAAFLLLNGAEIDATIDEQERIMLALASSQMNRQKFTDWLSKHVKAAADSQGV
jgi:death-on-curing protein